jgi:hypothetical protein
MSRRNIGAVRSAIIDPKKIGVSPKKETSPQKLMKTIPEDIRKIMEQTGVREDIARNMLKYHNGNLSMAIHEIRQQLRDGGFSDDEDDYSMKQNTPKKTSPKKTSPRNSPSPRKSPKTSPKGSKSPKKRRQRTKAIPVKKKTPEPPKNEKLSPIKEPKIVEEVRYTIEMDDINYARFKQIIAKHEKMLETSRKQFVKKDNTRNHPRKPPLTYSVLTTIIR